MRYYLIAGERSGDLHGANLIKELVEQDSNAKIRCWGGHMMKEAGGELVVHYKETAFMGFLEVVKNLRTIKSFIAKCKSDIDSWQPDVIVFIDYPGFNLRIAKYCKSKGYRTCYYISPKIWAWNRKRVYTIKKVVDQMYCILPFEKDFYKEYDFDVNYVGNPLIDSINNYQYDHDFINKERKKSGFKIAILPGSREQEVSVMLKVMYSMFVEFPQVHFYVAAVDNLPAQLYDFDKEFENVELHYNKAYDILKVVDGAIVTSGTATLETALMDVPQVVCYKTSPISYFIAKSLIKIKYISLVNLVANEEVVKELIQYDFNKQELSVFINHILSNDKNILLIRKGYDSIKKLIGNHETSKNTAGLIIEFLTNKIL